MLNLEEITRSIPGNIFWQDLENKYLGCNLHLTSLAFLARLQEPFDIVGKTIYDLLPAEYADPIFKIDQEVIYNQAEKITEENGLNNNNEPAIYLSKKMPIYDPSGAVAGLIGISFDITQYKKLDEYLAQAHNLSDALLKQTLGNESQKKYMSLTDVVNEAESSRFYLLGGQEDLYFTRREAQCALYAVKGKTAKEIARLCDLSPRTVEYYLGKVKVKLKCRTITELIGKLVPHLKGM